MRIAILFVLLLVGCGQSGPTRTEKEIAEGQAALAEVLNAWQKNEPASKTPTFTEDWRKTHTLVEYTIGKATVPDARTISYNVTLKLKDKKGTVETREAAYLVMLGNPNRVSRDPYN